MAQHHSPTRRYRSCLHHLPKLLRLRQCRGRARSKIGISGDAERLQDCDRLIRLPIGQIKVSQIEDVTFVARADRQCLAHGGDGLARIARSGLRKGQKRIGVGELRIQADGGFQFPGHGRQVGAAAEATLTNHQQRVVVVNSRVLRVQL